MPKFKKFFEVFFKTSDAPKYCAFRYRQALLRVAVSLRQLAYNNPLIFFCKAFL